MREGNSYKLNIWNILGLVKEEEWITNLSIGSVMNMVPMYFSDIQNKLQPDDLEE